MKFKIVATTAVLLLSNVSLAIAPPEPLSVVIQANKVNGDSDVNARNKVLATVAAHTVQDRIIRFVQPVELQSDQRSYICIEYRNSQDAKMAEVEFQIEMQAFPNIDVLSNMNCKL